MQDGYLSHKVYALLDPRDDPPSVRYVGRTSGTVDNRLSLHISEASRFVSDRDKDIWLRNLLSEGLQPMLLVLERTDAEHWEEREAYWIRKYQGPLLTNAATGGKGSPGAKRSPVTKKSIGDAFRGKELSDEHRRKISASKMGHDVSEHTRELLRQKQTGRKLSEATRRAISAGNFGKTHTAEARKSISETRKRLLAEGALQMPAGGSVRAAELISGSIWITDGNRAQRLPKGQPIPDGWRQGRK